MNYVGTKTLQAYTAVLGMLVWKILFFALDYVLVKKNTATPTNKFQYKL